DVLFFPIHVLSLLRCVISNRYSIFLKFLQIFVIRVNKPRRTPFMQSYIVLTHTSKKHIFKASYLPLTRSPKHSTQLIIIVTRYTLFDLFKIGEAHSTKHLSSILIREIIHTPVRAKLLV